MRAQTPPILLQCLSIVEKRDGAPCRVKIHRIKLDVRERGSGKVMVVGAHLVPDQHLNLITSRGSPLAHACHVWSTIMSPARRQNDGKNNNNCASLGGVTAGYLQRRLHNDRCITRTPAVAERPRNASCLSVVSFNSTIRRAQSSVIVTSASDLPLRTNKFCFLRCIRWSMRSRICAVNRRAP